MSYKERATLGGPAPAVKEASSRTANVCTDVSQAYAALASAEGPADKASMAPEAAEVTVRVRVFASLVFLLIPIVQPRAQRCVTQFQRRSPARQLLPRAHQEETPRASQTDQLISRLTPGSAVH